MAGLERGAQAGDLRPYASRGTLQWLRDEPHVRHRRIDGTLVFVDISGFTAMSERLARLGRVGAEEVTDLLNQTFSRLLAVAYEDDGSLLKFGGDALLVQFDGPGHAPRGVHAAWGMRRKLRELQPLQSSAGQVRLRMSIGVHTGGIDHFLVGSTHRELLLAGPAVTETVRMESAATAGQIVLSAATVEAVGVAAAVTPLGPGFLLRGTPLAPPVRPAADPGADAGDVALSVLSEPVRRRLAAGVPEAEHRPSVVGFVKFTGIDGLLAAEGPARAADALQAVVDAVIAAAAPHDVCLLASDVDADGGKLILTAGVPTSEEFDGERMLRSLRRLVEQDLPLPLKIGVHHGPVFAGVVGPWFRLTYTIIGDAVNTAARVMSRAEPGDLLATAEVLNRSQALFDIDELPPFAVKGKKQPLVAYRVGPVTADRLRRPRARFRLAGRHGELAALLEEVDGAADGPGRIVQLLGPAGIGKSRLIDEVHERRPHATPLMVACNRYESTTPYHVVGLLVRALLDLPHTLTESTLLAAVLRHTPHLEESLPLLGDVLGVAVADNDATRDLTAAYRAERAAAAVVALLEAVVPEPAVLVVEDLHWVDPESWSTLRAIVRTALPRRRWLLVLTSRHRLVLDLESEHPERVVELPPLTPEVARELVFAAVEEGLVSLDRGRLLLDKAEGNPFFLQELLQSGREGDELPDSVDALIQTQLDLLAPRDREVLGYAAVLGSEIDVDLLARTAGISVSEQQATFARLSTFVEPAPGGSFRFRHALVHDGAYGRLPFRRRRQLHRAAAEALEAQRRENHRPDLLALHTFHARDWDRARTYALEAAESAAARFANLSAAEHYRRAVEAGRHVRDLPPAVLGSTWERLGDALMLSCSYEQAVAAYRNARRFAEPRRQVHLCGQIGQLRERQGRYGEALRWFTKAVALDEELAAGETGRMLVESAIVRIRQGRPQDAIELAERSRSAGGDLQTAARRSYVRAWAAMLVGEDAAEERQRTLELFEQADDLIGQGLAWNVISMAAYYRGDWDEAAAAYERAAALRRRVGDEVAAAAAAGNLGELLSDQGHFDRARGLLEECRTVCAATGFRSSRYFAEMTLGRLEARLGRYDEAEALLTAALAELEGMHMAALAYDAQRYLGELALFRGQHEQALATAEALRRSSAAGAAAARLVGQRLRTCALVEQGEVEAARAAAHELLAEIDPEAHDQDTALCLVAAAAALEQANDPRARPTAERARAILDRLGVVVPGELLVFGPDSARADAGAA